MEQTSRELRSMVREESNPKNILRLQSLLHTKEKTFKRQSDLAGHLGYNVRTMELWLKVYKEHGIQAMLVGSTPRKARARKISKEVHMGLSEKLNNSFEGFGSYVDAVEWVERTYGVRYPYGTLRDYMIDVFGSRAKQPRRSHVKKNSEAQADFLKLT